MKFSHSSLLIALLVCFGTSAYGQGAKNIRINEVLVGNTTSLEDAYGQHLPWVELVNVSYSTYNVRGMFLTTDRRVLDKTITAPERISMMSQIPSGDACTVMNGRQHLVLYLGSNPARGAQHLAVPVDENALNWVALYDGNGVDLIDSVSIPALNADCSYARLSDGGAQWEVRQPDEVTAGTENERSSMDSKVARLKKNDPHGFGITVLSMGIVFGCLALLYVFFSVFGIFMKRKQQKKEEQEKQLRKENFLRHKTKVLAEAQAASQTKDAYMALIALALKQYQDEQHDEESGIITIKPKFTSWVHIAQETGEPRN